LHAAYIKTIATIFPAAQDRWSFKGRAGTQNVLDNGWVLLYEKAKSGLRGHKHLDILEFGRYGKNHSTCMHLNLKTLDILHCR
jgi:hypothetical protein